MKTLFVTEKQFIPILINYAQNSFSICLGPRSFLCICGLPLDVFFLWSLYSFLCLFIFVYVKFKVDIWYLLQESWFLWISCRDLSSKPPLGMAQMTHLYISCGVAWTIIGRVSSIMRPTCKVKVTFWSKDCWKLD